MIVALSLNPCVDKSARIARFDPAAPNRIQVLRRDVGGKGVNVARAVCALGGDGILRGLDFDGEPVAAALRREGVPFRLTPVPGEMRVNIKLLETETGRTLEISEQGPRVTEKDLNGALDALISALHPGDWVCLSGSLPHGAPRTVYADLCRRVQEKGARAAVDCDGEALLAALGARPALIKPNAQEFEALTGVSCGSEAEILEACGKLLEKGVGRVCLSLGSRGAVLASPRGAWACPAADVPCRGTQGAGDSMLAAFLLALERGMAEKDALRFASAAAGASVQRSGTLLCRREDAEALFSALPEARPM